MPINRQFISGFDAGISGFDANFFKSRNLDEKYLDAMALEYARLKDNTWIAILFPAAKKDLYPEIKEILNTHCTIVYEKNIALKNEGPLNLIKHIYNCEPWMGNWDNNFRGARYKTQCCFPGNHNSIIVFLLESENLEKMRTCKKTIRALCNVENHSIHTNDTHNQTISDAQVLFNQNSIHFLNHSIPKKFNNFEKFIDEYKHWLKKENYDSDNFCIDGSAILSAYGIRDCQDLDFIHFGYDFLTHRSTGNHYISSHNDEIKYHTTNKDNIIFNPENHFYHKDVKFASLNITKQMKSTRNEKKDQHDIASIESHMNN